MLKQHQLKLVFSLIIIAVLLIMYNYNHNETLVLEKKLARINKELHLKQVTFERRQKTYNEKAKQQRAEIERMRNQLKP
ncbi:hypothetical protein E0I61_09770 [Flavobacterium ranwuense]|uniref:Uncharacterized protein n=1 Tax=Flavobacterium ranwuense TaxID=2541725 RepID=A0ABY2DWK9_9FLAO|nr:hypothetical protein [Flavobacterium ranwuense]TDE29433.1 hypothetical protein E0I61_09770 [Flavobacterium ranwuense]